VGEREENSPENLGDFSEEERLFLEYLESALKNPGSNKKILLYPCCGDENAGNSEGHVVQPVLFLGGDNSKFGRVIIFFPIFTDLKEGLKRILGKIPAFGTAEIKITDSSSICPECYSSKFGSGDKSLNPKILVTILGIVKKGDGGERKLILKLGREDERVMSLFPWLGEIEKKLGELGGENKKGEPE